MALRKPSRDEERLLRALGIRATGVRAAPSWIDQLRVEEMSDGGMGSLILCLPGTDAPDRKFGAVAAELRFPDEDGVLVIASLNVDTEGFPLELDMWRTDFSPLIRIPDPIPAND
jgi:hypothetical protein